MTEEAGRRTCADGVRKADVGLDDELVEHDREDDTADRRSTRDESDSKGTATFEPMALDTERRKEEKADAEPAEDALDDHGVPVLRGLRDEKDAARVEVSTEGVMVVSDSISGTYERIQSADPRLMSKRNRPLSKSGPATSAMTKKRQS